MNRLSAEDQRKLESLCEKIETNTRNFLGYPVSKDFDYSELVNLLKFPINNLGDPFAECTYAVDSREMEREVLEFFAQIFRAPKSDWWGYVTNGGSEGNMYGLYMARELHPKGMVYYSAATHYSVHKNLHLLNMPNIVIRTQKNGEIDYEDLSNTIRMNRHMPVIIMANIGTTMTEAKDDINKIKAILNDAAIQNYYIHCDGALSGSISPFLEPRPAFDFMDGADSIAVSGHKFIGSPIPSGVLLVKKSHRDRIARSVAYIGSLDTTITGSRNGHSPIFLWYAIKTLGYEGLKKRVEHSLKVANYVEERLKSIGIEAWRNPNAITVVFPQPHEMVRKKWQLASEKGWSHVICMPNVTEQQIDELISDIQKQQEVVLK
ncbi:histidine decarboxylase [Solitalea lacus]|uniref:histidine decarboxylase n=1 Tax=Solitalea lacus TaxID=2911172 RepID=UPI001ED9D4F7|nr:histidine decarboxylase [Solitalea lacus]UKJ06451.1 histidine decarboxylase [Solitalea lacus]